MAVRINADTVTGGAIVTADATGILELQSGGTTAVTLQSGNTTIAQNATITQKLTATGTASIAGMKVADILETVTISATAATGTVIYDVTTQAVLYYTTNASANWTLNLRASSGTSLNTLMAVGESVTVAFLVTQGATAYYNNVVQVDGTTVTPKYQGGTAWTSGNINSIDVYSYTVIKTAATPTYVVLASQTKFT